MDQNKALKYPQLQNLTGPFKRTRKSGVPGFVFVEQIRQQSSRTDEGVVRTGDVVTVLDENYVGWYVGVVAELVEAGGDVGFEGV